MRVGLRAGVRRQGSSAKTSRPSTKPTKRTKPKPRSGSDKPPKRPVGWENIEVRRSAVHGRGLFAARDLPKGTYVMEYKGERVDKKESERRTALQWENGRVYVFELSRRFDLDGAVRSNLARLANFSCDPNCESINDGGRHIWIVAMRAIRKGEELTYDYNFAWDPPPPVCKCGSPKCRGYIVGSDHVDKLKQWLAEQQTPHSVRHPRRKR